MELKYKAEIEKMPHDFSEFSNQNIPSSFRWVFEGNQEENFWPVYRISPNRPRITFKGWALSFFNSQTNAKARLLNLMSNKPEIYKKLGTHIAQLSISTDDGITENIVSENGHFDHFEYETTNFLGRYTIIERIAG